jgi:hypothetical protein
LEDESHALVAQAGKSVSGKGIEGGVLEEHLAGFGGFKTGKGIKKGGLPSTAGAAQKDGLPSGNLEINAA